MLFDIPTDTLILAVVGGIIPALIWLWFWIKDDVDKPEPRSVIFLSFLAGFLGVFLVIPIQRFTSTILPVDEPTLHLFWALIEEVVKFSLIALVALSRRHVNEPTDYVIYLVTGALGFAAAENTLFILNPIIIEGTTIAFMTGGLRFIGTTIMHVMAGSIIGLFLGFAFYKTVAIRILYLIVGFILALALHGAFNYFIITNNSIHFLFVFAGLWVVAIIRMLLFERLRTVGERVH